MITNELSTNGIEWSSDDRSKRASQQVSKGSISWEQMVLHWVYFVQLLQGLEFGPMLLFLARPRPLSPLLALSLVYCAIGLPLAPRSGRGPLFGAGFPSDPVTLSSGLLRIRRQLKLVLTSCLQARSPVLGDNIVITRDTKSTL